MSKEQLRRQMLARRKSQDSRHITALSERIAERTIPLLRGVEARSVHVYRSNKAWNEVDTSSLLRLIDSTMPMSDVTIGQLGRDAELPTKRYDVIIVPLVAGDERCNRLGLGAGWYDRFLSDQPTALKIGVAFEFQITPVIPVVAHDEPLDIIVTDQRSIRR
jgi:5-formyltetrahydrofolate cyclo-ligase